MVVTGHASQEVALFAKTLNPAKTHVFLGSLHGQDQVLAKILRFGSLLFSITLTTLYGGARAGFLHNNHFRYSSSFYDIFIFL